MAAAVVPGVERQASGFVYGCCVSLLAENNLGFVASDGFADCGIEVRPGSRSDLPRAFKECVFEVVPRQQYGALERLLDAQRRTPRHTAELARIQESARVEEAVNADVRRKMTGHPVLYGQTVQLLHRKSDKFITACPHVLAQLERDCMRVELQDIGSSASHWTIQPRYKRRKAGEPLEVADHFLLTNKVWNVTLHVSESMGASGEGRGPTEVNGSLRATSWAFVLYSLPVPPPAAGAAPAAPGQPPAKAAAANLKGGDFIRLYHAEREGFVLFEDLADISKHLEVHVQTKADDDVAALHEAHQKQQQQQHQQSEHDFDDADLQAADGEQPDDMRSTVALWEVENEDASDGGAVEWDMPVRLRHLSRGKYLALMPSGAMGSASAAPGKQRHNAGVSLIMPGALHNSPVERHVREYLEARHRLAHGSLDDRVRDVVLEVSSLAGQRGGYLLTLTDRPSDDTIFTFMPTVEDMDGPIPHNVGAHVYHPKTDTWLHATHAVSALRPDLVRLSASRRALEEDAFQVLPAAPAEVEDVERLLAQVPPLRAYVDHFRRREPANSALYTQTAKVLRSMILFCVDAEDRPFASSPTAAGHAAAAGLPSTPRPGAAGSAAEAGGGGGKKDADFELSIASPPVRSRQRLLREQSVVPVLVDMLRVPFSDWGGAHSLAGLEEARRMQKETGLVSPAVHAFRICRLAYRLISLIFHDNRENEHYCARYMDTFVAQLGYDLTAEATLTHLLDNNLQLLEGVKLDVVRIFMSLIKTKGRRVVFVNFLTALCSCLGQSVPSKQDLVCDVLFGDGDGVFDSDEGDSVSDAVMRVRPHPHAREQDEEGAQFAPLQVCVDGRWQLIRDFYASDHALRDYFTATVRLYTTMCWGRNYNCIGQFERMFPREGLLACVKDSRLPYVARAHFCSLLLSLHIDRHPQEHVPVPSLVRIWATASLEPRLLGRHRRPSASLDSSPDDLFFAQMRRYIVEYVRKCRGNQLSGDPARNYLTLSLVELCLTLFHFGLYQDPGEIRELVEPLLSLLDGRLDDASATSAHAAPGGGGAAAPELAPLHHSATLRRMMGGVAGLMPQQQGHGQGQRKPRRRRHRVAPLHMPHLGDFRGLRHHHHRFFSGDGADSHAHAAQDEAEAARQRRYEVSEVSSIVVVQCKVAMCRVLRHIGHLGLDFQVSQALKVFHSYHVAQYPGDFVQPSPRRRRAQREALEAQEGKGDDVPKLAVKVSATQLADEPAAPKKERHTLNRRDVGQLLRANFGRRELTPEQRLCAEMAELGRRRILDADDMSSGDLVAVLLDLLMYKQIELQHNALELLVQHYNRRELLIRQLRQVQLLVAPDIVDVFEHARRQLSALKRLQEAAELWLGSRAREHDQVLDIVSHLELLAAAGRGELVPFGAAPSLQLRLPIDRERQKLLRLMGAHARVLDMLRSANEFIVNRVLYDRLTPDAGQCAGEVLAQCVQFLRAFAHRCPENQALIYPQLDLLLDLVRRQVVGAEVIFDVLVDNPELCAGVGETFVQVVLDVLDEQGPQPQLLDVLDAITWCDGVAIKENQDTVLRLLMEKRREPHVLDLYAATELDDADSDGDGDMESDEAAGDPEPEGSDPESGVGPSGGDDDEGLRRLQALMGDETELLHVFQPQRTPLLGARVTDAAMEGVLVPRVEPSSGRYRLDRYYEPRPLLYFLRLIRTLGSCTTGHNFVCEAKAQGLLPLRALMSLLAHPKTIMPLRLQLLYLLVEGWLDTERHVKALSGSQPLVEYLTAACKELHHEFFLNIQFPSRRRSVAGGGSPGEAVARADAAARAAAEEAVRQQCQNTALYRAYAFQLVAALEFYFRVHYDPQFAPDRQTRLLAATMRLLADVFDMAEDAPKGFWRSSLTTRRIENLLLLIRSLQTLRVPDTGAGHSALQPDRLEELKTHIRRVTPTDDLAAERRSSMATPMDQLSVRVTSAYAVFLKTISTDPMWIERLERDFEVMVGAIVGVEAITRGRRHAPTPCSASAEEDASPSSSSTDDSADDDSGSADHDHSRRFHEEGLAGRAFEELMLRLVHLGRQCGMTNPSAARVVLRVMTKVLTSQHVDMPSVQTQLDALGASRMTLELLCNARADAGDYTVLLQLAIALLDEGNRSVQKSFFELFQDPMHEPFFHQIGARLDGMVKRLGAPADGSPMAPGGGGSSTGGSEPRLLARPSTRVKGPSTDRNLLKLRAADYAPTVRLVRFLQLLCEGHNRSNQEYLARQRHSLHSVNLVAGVVHLLTNLADRLDARNIELAEQLLDTITECVQDNLANQERVVDSKFVETAGALLRCDGGHSQMKRLKFKTVLTLNSLLEGRTDSVLHDRMATLLPVAVMRDNMQRVYQDFVTLHDSLYSQAAFLPELLHDGSDDDDESASARFQRRFTTRVLLADRADAPGNNDDLADCAVLDTGFAIYILINNLLDRSDAEQKAELEENFVPSEAEIRRLQKDMDVDIFDSLAAQMGQRQATVTYKQAYAFFDRYTCSVEIVRAGELQRFYFPKPPMCTYLTEQTKKSLLWGVDHSNVNNKIQDFFARRHFLIMEMMYQQALEALLQKTRIFYYLSKGGPLWKTLSFAAAVIINLLLLWCFAEGGEAGHGTSVVLHPRDFCDSSLVFGSVSTYSIILFVGGIQVATSSLIVGFFVLNYGALIVLNAWWARYEQARRRELSKSSSAAAAAAGGEGGDEEGGGKPGGAKDGADRPPGEELMQVSQFEQLAQFTGLAATGGLGSWLKRALAYLRLLLLSLGFLLKSPLFVYYGLYVTFTLLGLSVHVFFFAFHIFDFVLGYEELKIVLQAVVQPIRSLVLVVLLFCALEYIAAIIAFAGLRHGFNTGDCDSLARCFVTIFDQGFKNDGGIGGYLDMFESGSRVDWTDSQIAGRVVYDSLFNLILLTLLLNIVFGIIIDTFGALREVQGAKVNALANVCFICSLSRTEFDRHSAKGFDFHRKREHNMWSYLFLFCHLQFKKTTEHTGIEHYLYESVAREEVSAFFPLHQAIALTDDARAGGGSGGGSEDLSRSIEVGASLKKVDDLSKDMQELRAEVRKLGVRMDAMVSAASAGQQRGRGRQTLRPV